MSVEKLDNRPRWMMGGLRDDTGAVNSVVTFGHGYGLDQTRLGVKTNTEGVDIGFGQASMSLDGAKQTEYSGILGQREGLDQRKEKLNEKVTEAALQAKLFQ